MDEPDKPDQGGDSFFNKMKKKAQFNGDMYSKKHTREILAGILVLLGLILAFFYTHFGALCVGLGFAICFYPELHNFFLHNRDGLAREGLSKILVGLGTLLFLLLTIPAFICAVVIGFGVMWLITHDQSNIR